MSDKIFVQIASYRDPELIPTVIDMINRASHPENLTFGICWQYDETEDTSFFDREGFTVAKYHYSESQGLGWARAITNSLYNGEKYTLQIDSHHRFVDGWDDILIEDYNSALEFSEKPIITTYCTPFETHQSRDEYNQVPCLMSQYEFSSDKLLMSMPWYIQDYKQRNQIIKARTLSGHFYFTSGEFIKEVPYDPEIYFGGYTEETTMSVRAFTNGYDMFSPYRMVMWHEYTRAYRPKHWEDHSVDKTKTEMDSGKRDVIARNKTRQIFQQEDHGFELGIFGLGNVRTLHDYEKYGGFDFKNCKIQEYTLQVKEPHNPLPWKDGFISKKVTKEIQWDSEFFKEKDSGDYEFITFGIINKFGEEVFRKDFRKETDPTIFSYDQNNLTIEYNSEKEDKLVMYGYSTTSGWTERYEKAI